MGIESKIYETDSDVRLEVYKENAIKLLRLVMPYLRHPLRCLRAKLILMFYDGKIDDETFTELYEQTEYEDENDPKRGHAVEALARAAPQTHTHGERDEVAGRRFSEIKECFLYESLTFIEPLPGLLFRRIFPGGFPRDRGRQGILPRLGSLDYF